MLLLELNCYFRVDRCFHLRSRVHEAKSEKSIFSYKSPLHALQFRHRASTPLLSGHQSTAQVGRPEFFKSLYLIFPSSALFSYSIPFDYHSHTFKMSANEEQTYVLQNQSSLIPLLFRLLLPLAAGKANQLL